VEEKDTERSQPDAYEPPAIVSLGSVEEFTVGDLGDQKLSPTFDGEP
jgi:hypothetical protein